MSEPITTANKPETILVHQTRVACDGPAEGKHPRVFLTMVDDANGNPHSVTCPYCSRVFVYQFAPKIEGQS